MDVPQLSPELREALRTWFHSKDRSVYLAANTFAYLPGGIGYLSMAFVSETILSASAASVTFSNIPQGFRHLMLICRTRTDAAAETDTLVSLFNSDTGANYDFQQVLGSSATATASASRARNNFVVGTSEAANSRGNNFGPAITFILGYSLAGIEKSGITLFARMGDVSADTDLIIGIAASRWRNTNVLTSITFQPNTGPNFVSGSSFQLYGVL